MDLVSLPFQCHVAGINVVLAGAGPAHALYFGIYERAKKAVDADGSKPLATGESAKCIKTNGNKKPLHQSHE